jgi:hypothetical protein
MRICTSRNPWQILRSILTGICGSSAAIAGAGVVLVAVGSAHGFQVITGSTNDENIQMNWTYYTHDDSGMLIGEGQVYLLNVGHEPRSEFRWKIADLTFL